MKVHQFVHTLNYGDAISGEALAMKRLLADMGVGGEIFCLCAHEKVASECYEWKDGGHILEQDCESAEDVAVVLHYSLASSLNEIYANLRGAKRAIIYHNLTPAHWFYGYNARVVADLEAGREELPALLSISDLVLADSEFNRQELVDFGCEHAVVLPLLLDQSKWAIADNPGIASILKGHGGKNILHVGRLAPNKRIEDIIKAFYFYHHKIEQNSRLWLVGSDTDTEIYSFELKRLIAELQLSEAVTLVGPVADSELKSFYQNSDLYLCMSEHEGFCVPLLEAMHFGLPVIAYGACAVPDTLGDAGLVLKDKSPAEVAELMQLLLGDSSLRQKLVERGKARVASYGEAQFAANLRSILLDGLEGTTAEEAISNVSHRA